MIYASVARMFSNEKSSGKDFGDIFQLINWVLDSGAMCHVIIHVSDFFPGSFEEKDKYIEVTYGHHVTEKLKGQMLIKCVTITKILLSRHCTTYFWN